MPSEVRPPPQKIRQCSILGPQNLGSRGAWSDWQKRKKKKNVHLIKQKIKPVSAG